MKEGKKKPEQKNVQEIWDNITRYNKFFLNTRRRKENAVEEIFEENWLKSSLLIEMPNNRPRKLREH